MTRVGEFVTLAPSLAASSGSHTGVAVLCPSGPLDLSEESMTRVGSAVSTIPSERYPSGSLDLSEESMTRGGSAVSTVLADRLTLGLASLGMLTMFLEVLRLVICRLGDGSGVLLRGISSSVMISLLRPWELDILLEMFSWIIQHCRCCKKSKWCSSNIDIVTLPR